MRTVCFVLLVCAAFLQAGCGGSESGNSANTNAQTDTDVNASPGNSLAFVTTAHRGQNGPDDNPIDAQLTTPSVGRADVWVFDARATGNSLGGDPLAVLSMFGDTTGALSTSPDGTKVYAAVMHSGNQTTAVGENNIAKSGPVQSRDGTLQTDTGLIVKFDGTNWHDDAGATADSNRMDYNSLVKFTLPENDVFVIETTSNPTVPETFQVLAPPCLTW